MQEQIQIGFHKKKKKCKKWNPCLCIFQVRTRSSSSGSTTNLFLAFVPVSTLSIDVSVREKQEVITFNRNIIRDGLLSHSFLASSVLYLTAQVIPHALSAMVLISESGYILKLYLNHHTWSIHLSSCLLVAKV